MVFKNCRFSLEDRSRTNRKRRGTDTDVATLDRDTAIGKRLETVAVFTEIKRFPDAEEIKNNKRNVREKRNSKHVLTNGNGRPTRVAFRVF